MNKRITSILAASILAVSMVGCSNNMNKNKGESSIKEEKHMTEKERIATLKGLEGNELTEAYRKLLTEDEINFLNNHDWKIEEEAKNKEEVFA